MTDRRKTCDCIRCKKNGESCCEYAETSICPYSLGGLKRYHLIKASAGTGKTFRLASRYAQLVLMGEAPESIVALTFTKKAAGEIYHRIIRRMLDLAEKQSRCQLVTPPQIQNALARILNPKKTLQIGTIDSFFFQILRAFALELGVWGSLNMYDYEDGRYRNLIIQELLEQATEEQLQELREQLKLYHNLSGKARPGEDLTNLIDSLYSIYLSHSNKNGEPIPWGNVWKNAKNPYKNDRAKLRDDTDQIEEYLKSQSNATLTRRLKAFCSFVKQCVEANDELCNVLPEEIKSLSDNFTKYNGDDWCGLESACELMYTKKISLPQDVSNPIRRLFHYLMFLSCKNAQYKSEKIFSLLRTFDEIYRKRIRNQGLLTFVDVPFLLGQIFTNHAAFGMTVKIQDFEYRIDSSAKHIMLDEFQDTSDSQWFILENVLKDKFFSQIPNDFSSFFCVGDIKQSVYQWRGGDPNLFLYLENKLEDFARELGYDCTEVLTESYRSTPCIMDFVNLIFDKRRVSGENGIVFENNKDVFNKFGFVPHESRLVFKKGFVQVFKQDNAAKGENDLARREKTLKIIEILNHVQPWTKNLSVAILLRTNKQADEYWIELENKCREQNITDLKFSVNGKISPCNFAAFAPLKYLLLLSVHPEDSFANEYLKMLSFDSVKSEKNEILGFSGLAELLGFEKNEQGETTDLAKVVRDDIFLHGIKGFIQRYQKRLAPFLAEEDKRKLAYLLDVADGFHGSVDEFIHMLEHVRVDDKSVRNTIQIMTIHQSKGLEFDLLFIPELDETHGGHVSTEPDMSIPYYSKGNTKQPQIEWISYSPNPCLACCDSEFQKYLNAGKREELFAKLCTAYVAMTRAKHALYVFVTKLNNPPQDPLKINMNEWVFNQINNEHPVQNDMGKDDGAYQCESIYQAGEENWHEEIHGNPIKTDCKFSPDDCIIQPIDRTKRNLTASETQLFKKNTALRFEAIHATNIGTFVHELFMEVDFLESEHDVEKTIDHHHVSSRFENDFEKAVEIFRQTLLPADSSEIFRCLQRPSGAYRLWKEKRFLCKNKQGALISGAFDRVLIVLDEHTKKTSSAIIYDYKTDKSSISELIERHTEQLEIYRECLGNMLDLNPEKIRCVLLSTFHKKAIELD